MEYMYVACGREQSNSATMLRFIFPSILNIFSSRQRSVHAIKNFYKAARAPQVGEIATILSSVVFSSAIYLTALEGSKSAERRFKIAENIADNMASTAKEIALSMRPYI